MSARKKKAPAPPAGLWKPGTFIPSEARRHSYGGAMFSKAVVDSAFARAHNAICDIEENVRSVTMLAWERLEPDPMGLAASEAAHGVLYHDTDVVHLFMAALRHSILDRTGEFWLPPIVLDGDLPDCLTHMLIVQQEATFLIKREDLARGSLLAYSHEIFVGLEYGPLKPSDTGFAIGYRPRADVVEFIAAEHNSSERVRVASMMVDIKRGMDAYERDHPVTP